ncbi:MAG: formylglycine-generating enzyme family protein [Deltaproteobacteria bacterium]|nr:formylglycine-generating enzyme family protein [Deltaproteobacteria bacterium]
MSARKVVIIPLLALVWWSGCSGSQTATDAGTDAGQDGGTDGGHQLWGECPFPYTVPGEQVLQDALGQDHTYLDIHVRCQLEFEGLHAEIFVVAEAVEVTNFDDVTYEAARAFLCREQQVEELPAGSFLFALRHHMWKDIEVAFEGRRYVYEWSEVCMGARPCTPWPDLFDVRRLDDGSLIAEGIPAICAGVGEQGVPAPLVPQVRIPPEGTAVPFMMGSDQGDSDELPIHEVIVYPNRLDVHEATNQEFAFFLNDHGNDCEATACVDTGDSALRIQFEDEKWVADQGFEHHPVVAVSWYGANEYCAWRRMILPYESIWELAASAMGERTYPWGDQDPACNLSLYDACTETSPQAVCSLPDGNSREGICNLSGNVMEWVQDWYQADYYTTCQDSGSGCFRGPWTDTGLKVLRGGSFDRPAFHLRAAERFYISPDTTSYDLGFRCMSSNPSF